MQAILLCAGRGRRLGMGIPKCLLRFNGKTLIQYQLEILSKVKNLNEVVVVTGFLHDDVVDAIECFKNDIDLEIKTVYNKEHSIYGINRSLQYANELITSDVILRLDGDLLLNDFCLGKLVEYGKTCALVQNCQVEKNTAFIKPKTDNTIDSILIDNAKKEHLEWLCIECYFNNDFRRIMQYSNNFVDLKYNFADLLNFCITSNVVQLYYRQLDAKTLEIDTIEDLEYVRKTLSSSQ